MNKKTKTSPEKEVPGKHYHFSVMAYNDIQDNIFVDGVVVNVIAISEIQAFELSRKLVQRNNYKLQSVSDCHGEEVLELQRKLLTKLKDTDD